MHVIMGETTGREHCQDVSGALHGQNVSGALYYQDVSGALHCQGVQCRALLGVCRIATVFILSVRFYSCICSIARNIFFI